MQGYFENIDFTEKAQAALSYAVLEAKELGSNVVGTEHLLYGLCLDPIGIAATVLIKNNLTPVKIHEAICRLTNKQTGSINVYTGEVFYTIACDRVIRRSKETALNYGHSQVGTEHLLVTIFREVDSIAVRVLIDLGVDPTMLFKDIVNALQTDDFTAELQKHRGGQDVTPMERMAVDFVKKQSEENMSFLEKYGTDLTRKALEGSRNIIIGREKEMNRVFQVLGRKTKNNPCLVGEPGVGKTAIVEGLAQMIADGNVGGNLKKMRIISIDLSAMVSGAKYRGEFEERFKRVLAEAKADPKVILFLDEIHTIIGTGNAEGSLDAANILKPELSRGSIKLIGSTTLREYRKYIESDPALERRFQPINVEEPNEEETIEILRGLKGVYEKHHNVFIKDDAIKAAVNLSKRYIHDRFLPDKAIDIIDEAASYKSFQKMPPVMIESDNSDEQLKQTRRHLDDAIFSGRFEDAAALYKEERFLTSQKRKNDAKKELSGENVNIPTVEENDITEIVSNWTGVPLTKLDLDESKRLLNIESIMHERVVGQDDAVNAVAKAIRRGRTGLKDPNRPVGSFIFLGPTGVGKTEVSKALAEALFGDEAALIKFDMSEFMESASVSKLIGSPPGYVGFTDEPLLSKKIRNQPYSVVLFDEIEKAHPDIFNILLQILDEGQITDSKGRKLDFKNSVVIMTSNVGARNISEPKTLGFTQHSEAEKHEIMKKNVNDELKKTFKPEFLNRIDDILVFKQLTKCEIKQITSILVNKLEKRAAANGMKLKVEEAVVELIAEKGYTPQYGARPIKRLLQNEIEDKVSTMMLESNSKNIVITVKNGEVVAENGKD
ncbi:MAG: ATP-dependent Clp protease ATP-binding subunit [Clostridia bacterium]|nr:ATP-dependent Clp protease ATP-binding subunit [Clostridia bacterium]